MIRRHEFNSKWWGSDVGVVDQAAFFELAVEERARALAPFAWVEYKGALEPGVGARAAAVGFVLTDTQLAFRLGLGRVGERRGANHGCPRRTEGLIGQEGR